MKQKSWKKSNAAHKVFWKRSFYGNYTGQLINDVNFLYHDTVMFKQAKEERVLSRKEKQTIYFSCYNSVFKNRYPRENGEI